jgi:hypothetical protein
MRVFQLSGFLAPCWQLSMDVVSGGDYRMIVQSSYRVVTFAIAALSLAGLACGLGTLTQTAQDAQAIATQAGDLAGTAQAVATQADVQAPADPGELPELPEGGLEVLAELGDVDGCALLTTAEIEAALGGPVVDTDANNVAGQSVCIYTSDTGREVALTLVQTVNADTASAPFQGYKAAAESNASLEPVAGEWDDGFWDTSNGMLYVMQGRYIVVMSAGDQTQYPDAQQQATSLATTLVGRLP